MRFIYYFISILPLKFHYLVSSFCSKILIHFYRKKIVNDNLKKSFPLFSEKKINSIMKLFYENFCDVFLETIKGYSISEEKLKRRVIYKNSEVINSHINKKERVILITSHQCNWEWLLLSLQLNLSCKLHAIYKKLTSKTFDQIMYKGRSRFGAELIEAKSSVKYLKNNLESINVLVMAADQSPAINHGKVWTKMLNQETAFFQGIEFLPKITNSKVYFMSMKRILRGSYTVEFKLLSSPPYDKNKLQILPLYASNVEDLIKERPHEWLWSHKRWKLKK
tara:strand:+ start:45529 stop:46365 length:837 start_codon:yes stop_codon:yes gene_type:complete